MAQQHECTLTPHKPLSQAQIDEGVKKDDPSCPVVEMNVTGRILEGCEDSCRYMMCS